MTAVLYGVWLIYSSTYMACAVGSGTRSILLPPRDQGSDQPSVHLDTL